VAHSCTLPLSRNQYKVSFLVEYFKPIRGFVADALMWPQGIVRHRPLVQGLAEFLHRRKLSLITKSDEEPLLVISDTHTPEDAQIEAQQVVQQRILAAPVLEKPDQPFGCVPSLGSTAPI